MNQTDVASEIRRALATLPGRDFSAVATDLLAAVGYRSDRAVDDHTATVDDFIERHPAAKPDVQTEQRFREAVESLSILFQFTDEEIAGQGSLFNDALFDTGNARSFLFAAVELKGASYPRGDYAAFAREINKRLSMPTVILFKTSADLLTLAFVHRRPNRRNPDRDVLGNVSLIREIRPTAPHRAHVDILAELSLAERWRWMDARGKSRNFDGLLDAWLDALDTEELNRRFYRELQRWFDQAVKPEFTRFPTAENKVLTPQEHVIRLITRMLFIWFIKEKGLVAPELFVENEIAPLLKDYDRATGDSYYRVVLQNLFFATLNTEIGRREFSSESNPTHRDFTRYRFRAEMAESDALLAHFSKTPFINGGLFDCLDSEEAKGQGGYRIDCFSDVDKRLLSIPNRLFFGPDGLIDLFNHYKFTVEENTPVEVEVALDPELLGKVFENLLAAYNPETKESARKQTGSYYTPRPVVDYMVDEALVASIVQKVAPDDSERTWWEDRLHYLLDYNDAGDLFLPEEADRVVRAIAELRALDPAVGSGAFPMGVLHKLTLALRRLDSDNRLWEALQRDLALKRTERAYDAATQQQRDQALQDISDTFERYRGSDFGRKLYLIQNSIYGVDIQPVATQIAKLRFFISLAIEQQPDAAAENYGIQPLPNLETRFVAADTLLGLDNKAVQIPLGGQNRVSELNGQLRQNRERHFHAGIRQEKLRLRREDARLRGELATELERAGMSKSDAGKIASWDPYDQNTHADWFDAGYMFDVRDGFDVVIGNPPYVVTKDSRLRALYEEGIYGRMNTYGLFIQRGLRLAKEGGQLTYINPRTMLTDRYFTNLRKLIRRNAELQGVVMISDRHNTFEGVLQECIIPHMTRKSSVSDVYPMHIRNVVRPDDLLVPHARISVDSSLVMLSEQHDGAFLIGTSMFDYKVFKRIASIGTTLETLGLKAETGKIQFDKYQEYAQSSNAGNACRLIWAENIQRYTSRETRVRTGKEWLAGAITQVVAPNIDGTGIVIQRVTANEQPRRIIATLITTEALAASRVYSENHTNFIPLERHPTPFFLLAVLNSSLMEFAFRRLNSNTQVSAGEINALPFPPMSDDATVQEIEAIATEIMNAGGVDCRSDMVQRTIANEHRLDVLIGSLYGFTEHEVRQIQASLPSYEMVYGIAKP